MERINIDAIPLSTLNSGTYRRIEEGYARLLDTAACEATATQSHGSSEQMSPPGLADSEKSGMRLMSNTPLHSSVDRSSREDIKDPIETEMRIDAVYYDGLTPFHMCVKNKLVEHLKILITRAKSEPNWPSLGIQDINGNSVLHTAVKVNWLEGVIILLKAGADVTAKNKHLDTPLHFASRIGNIDILDTLLTAVTDKQILDDTNLSHETPLSIAVTFGHTDCVKKLLEEGASITKTLPNSVNMFHIASEKGHADTLRVLFYHNTTTSHMIDCLTSDDEKHFGPIHLAIENNHSECVKLLLSKNASVALRSLNGSTPLHLTAKYNNTDIARIILEHDDETLHEVDDYGWTALHKACYYGSRDMIALLLKEGSDLSQVTDGPKNMKVTALDLIMNNIFKPTEYLEEVFDGYIYTNDMSFNDPNCKVTVDYHVLAPSRKKEQMKVVEVLLKTGDRYGQRRLLLHPLIESFLHLKWKVLQPHFFSFMLIYCQFTLYLTIYIVQVFYNIDGISSNSALKDDGTMIYIYTSVITAQEIMFISCNGRYYLQLEAWIRLASICIAAALPYSVTVVTTTGAQWPRHLATSVLLLTWLEMMVLLSRLPNWGYYVFMFGKVAANVVKILLTFAFLLIGFSLSFMVQFHSQPPFDNFWAALVKTITMMTSEFDYEGLVDKSPGGTSLIVVRLIYLLFLILAAIVLMNLMIGVAVNDLNNLTALGNASKLVKQLDYLASYEKMVCNKFINKISMGFIVNRTRVTSSISIYPSEPQSQYYKLLPAHIREDIFERAQRQKLADQTISSDAYKNKLDEIHDVVLKINNIDISGAERNQVEVLEQLSVVKNEINVIKSSIDGLNVKFNIILNKLDATS